MSLVPSLFLLDQYWPSTVQGGNYHEEAHPAPALSGGRYPVHNQWNKLGLGGQSCRSVCGLAMVRSYRAKLDAHSCRNPSGAIAPTHYQGGIMATQGSDNVQTTQSKHRNVRPTAPATASEPESPARVTSLPTAPSRNISNIYEASFSNAGRDYIDNRQINHINTDPERGATFNLDSRQSKQFRRFQGRCKYEA